MGPLPTSERRWDFDRVFRLLLTIITLLTFVVLVRYLSDVLIPFTVALLLAYLLSPLVAALDGRFQNRTLSVLVTVFGCALVGFAMFLALIYVGGQELGSLRGLIVELVQVPTKQDVQTVGQKLQAYIEQSESATLRAVLTTVRDHLAEHRTEYLEQLQPEQLANRAVRTLTPALAGVVTGVVSFVLGLSVLVIIGLYLVFLLIDYPLMMGTWKQFLPPKYREDIVGFLDEFTNAMQRYFRGQFIIAAIVGVLFAIGFKLIGLRMAILLGLGVGMLNMVPYLQTVGMIPAMVLGLVRGLEVGNWWLSPLMVLLVFGVVQALQDTVLTPRIMGKSVGLRPVMLLLSVFVWGKLLGFLGLVLAIPLTCLGLAYYRRFVLGDAKATAVSAE